MGKTKQEFLAQREHELMLMSSRQLKAEAQYQADQMLQDLNAEEIYSKSVRLEKYISEFNKSIKNHIKNMDTINGVEFQEGIRITFNFSDDPEYKELETLLNERKDLLQARVKLMKTIFDHKGEEVPLVTSKTTTFIKAIIK